MMIPTISRLTCLSLLTVIAGCDPDETLGIGRDYDPHALDATYEWVFEGWDEGDPMGYPLVELTWEIPNRYRNEVFRVYSRGGDVRNYILIATVTSCSGGVCRYGDTNVESGGSYDYYVATVDERDGVEVGASEAIRVDLPTATTVQSPSAPMAVGLDGAAYLHWESTGAERYQIVTELEDGGVFLIGETDGTSFVDDRAVNGELHRYYLAAVDAYDHVSRLSAPAEAFPRPDYHADIVYSHADLPSESGFRFVADPDAGDDPIVEGTAPARHWRLVEESGQLRIEPGPGVRITSGTFTTQLTCGPGSERDCVDVRTAPAASAFGSGSVPVSAGTTYVLRIDEGSQVRYAKIRVQGESRSAEGRLIVFDWAYQTRVNEPSLDRLSR